MKRNIAYVLGLILMFSTSGGYLNAQGMGGGGYGDDDGMRMHQKEGMREGKGMSDDGYRKNVKIIKKKKRGGKDGFSPKNMKMGYDRQAIEKDVMATIKKHDSSFAKKLEKLKDTDRRKYKLINIRTSCRWL